MVLPYENEDYGEVGAKNMSELLDVTLTSVTTGDLIKYDGSKFINFAPTYSTYTNGTGVSISPSNVISIGQSVGTSDSPSFTQLSLGTTGTNQGILNLKDLTNIGTEDVAQIKGIKEGTNGGQLQFYTKADSGGVLTERIIINNVGAIGIGGANYGTAGQVLTSNESGSAVSWATPTILTGSNFNVTVGTYPGNVSIPQLKANGSNYVHVFFADKSGVLDGHKEITSVNLYGGTSVSLFGDGANNVHVFYADIAGSLSDDRVKWNETPINTDRTIEIVKKIKFYQYDILKEPRKGSLDPEEPYDPSKCKVGFGVIAQEIEELSNEYTELKDTRFQIDEIKGVEYNNLLALLGATTQMLISRIETLENEVKQLKAK